MKFVILLDRINKKIFRVDKSFRTKSIITDRTVAVAEAFGIGIDERKFDVFKNFIININKGDIVYITGESGSGKSVLLRELSMLIRKNEEEFGRLIADNELRIDDDEVLVHGVGNNVEEALYYLSMAGLNDAFLFLRRYKELSDGQKYRYKIAKMLAMNADVFVFDEFCSTLDRETARIVSFLLQKNARRNNKTVLVATTHEDLFYDLSPNVHVRKNFSDDVEVNYYNDVNKECSLVKNIRIREGNYKEYLNFEKFHYRAKKPFGIRKIFIMEINDKPIGCIVYSISPLSCKPRNHYLNHIPDAEEINRDFLTISRVIIHPKYRGIGLGAKLVRETLPLASSKYVEAIAVMAKYNPFFERAGMLKVNCEEPDWKERMRKFLNSLERYGLSSALMSSIEYNMSVLKNLRKEDYENLVDEILKHGSIMIFGDQYKRKILSREMIKEDMINSIKNTAIALSKASIKAQRKMYYIWHKNNQVLN